MKAKLKNLIYQEWFCCFCFFCMIVAIIAGLTIGIGFSLYIDEDNKIEDIGLNEGDYKTIYEIKSLSISSETSGTFFLGTGTVDEVNYYTYFAKVDDLYKLDKTPSDGCFVKLDDSQSPKLVVKVTSQYWCGVKYRCYGERILIVPTSTIKEQVKLS